MLVKHLCNFYVNRHGQFFVKVQGTVIVNHRENIFRPFGTSTLDELVVSANLHLVYLFAIKFPKVPSLDFLKNFPIFVTLIFVKIVVTFSISSLPFLFAKKKFVFEKSSIAN